MTLIVYDFECQKCGQIFEVYEFEYTPGDATTDCIHCDGMARKIITKMNTKPQDITWLKSVTEVVDKDPSKRHCREFIKNPTRENYQAWMKGEGIRPMEPGEKPKAALPDPSIGAADKIMKMRQARNSINLQQG